MHTPDDPGVYDSGDLVSRLEGILDRLGRVEERLRTG
jgi:hypothetical protein